MIRTLDSLRRAAPTLAMNPFQAITDQSHRKTLVLAFYTARDRGEVCSILRFERLQRLHNGEPGEDLIGYLDGALLCPREEDDEQGRGIFLALSDAAESYLYPETQ